MRELEIHIHPFVIQVPEERESLYERLKKAVEEAEAIIADPAAEGSKTRIKALNVLAHLISVAKGLLKDAQLDELELTLRELRRKLDEYKAEKRN